MLKRIYFVVFAALVFLISGCTNNNQKFSSDAERFQYEYETMNGKYDDYGRKARSVSIGNDNPVVYASYTDIVTQIENNATFVVYFGFAKCPWCRGALEAMLESAKNNDIDLIYYVDVYDSRDTYEIKNGVAVKTSDGDEGYEELLSLLSSVLEDYLLQDADETEISVGEKRIYAPNVIAVKAGEAVGIAADSLLFTDPYGDITDEIYSDMLSLYNELFSLIAS